MERHEPTGNIVWQRADGSVAITWCFFGIDPAAERDKLLKRGDVPADWVAVAIDADVPPRDERRNALVWRNGKLEHDAAKVAEIMRAKAARTIPSGERP